MTLDAHNGPPQIASAASSVEEQGRSARAGRLLVALATSAVGVGCFLQPWLSGFPWSVHALLSFHALAGAALIVAGAGVAAGRRARRWALILGAAALPASIAGNVFPYRQTVSVREGLIRIALIGALLMLAGLERQGGGVTGRWFRAGRRIFAAGALLSAAAAAIWSYWLQSGVDMFYANFDILTLFNSIWSWRYPLAFLFGSLAMLGAAAIFFPRPARDGAISLAAASILFLPLAFLYRVDDFFGDPAALVEMLYVWALDLGLAGGALILVSALGQEAPIGGLQNQPLTGLAGIFRRRRWPRVAMVAAALGVAVAIALHGLIPFFFFEANTRGNLRLGELTARVFAATYTPPGGNSYWVDKVSEAMARAGPAGRACAAGDPEGCEEMADFYRLIGWNWGRAWRLSAKAADLFRTRCNGSDMRACFDLGRQCEQGYGVAADATRAAALYQEACEAGVGDGCETLSEDYWYGNGLPADKRKGATLMKKGCALGSQWACLRLGYMRHDLDWRPEFDK
jgi:hypothetical protein